MIWNTQITKHFWCLKGVLDFLDYKKTQIWYLLQFVAVKTEHYNILNSQGPWVLGHCYRDAIFKIQVHQGVGVCNTCIHADRQTDMIACIHTLLYHICKAYHIHVCIFYAHIMMYTEIILYNIISWVINYIHLFLYKINIIFFYIITLL